jgi:hypothetical protein
MYEMACTYSRTVLQGQDVEMRHKNTRALSRREVKETIDVIQRGNEIAVVKHIGELLQAGKSLRSIIDAIQLAATETILECGSPLAYNMPMHAYQYTNTVRWFFDRFDHPHMTKLLFMAGSFVNEVSQGLQAFPGNGPRNIKPSRSASGLSQGQLLEKLDEAIVGLQPDDAVGLVQAYVKAEYDRQPLISTIALGASKIGNDPHNQEIGLVQLEDFQRNTHAGRDRLLMGAAAFVAGHRKYADPLEAYRRFTESMGLGS